MMSGHVEYQILVVTRLAAFKSAKHKPDDVVQFLVSWGHCQDPGIQSWSGGRGCWRTGGHGQRLPARGGWGKTKL